MNTSDQIIAQTKKWLVDVVIGLNFCPFAAKEVKQNTVRYRVEFTGDNETCLTAFIEECVVLDNDKSIETTLLILPEAVESFADYLDLVSLAEELLEAKGYEGTYQVASFHPQYCFEASTEKDAANYTNRSPYPMLHLLREESIEAALARYTNPELIPERNVNFAREKGLAYMKMLRDACF